MYKQFLKTQSASSGGRGTFTSVKIPAGQPIMEIIGPVVLDREIVIKDYSMYLQVGPNTFIGSSGDVDDFFNHSCDPNCYVHVVGNRAILILCMSSQQVLSLHSTILLRLRILMRLGRWIANAVHSNVVK